MFIDTVKVKLLSGKYNDGYDILRFMVWVVYVRFQHIISKVHVMHRVL